MAMYKGKWVIYNEVFKIISVFEWVYDLVMKLSDS